MTEKTLNPAHWELEKFSERMTAAEWKNILLDENDKIMVKGHLRQVVAKNLGYGVVEVSKQEAK